MFVLMLLCNFAKTSNNVIACFAETFQTEKNVLFTKKTGHTPDHGSVAFEGESQSPGLSMYIYSYVK